MRSCPQCHRELDPRADICPHCRARQTTSASVPQTTTEVLPERPTTAAAIVSDLAILVGFFLPWFYPLSWPGVYSNAIQALEPRISLSGLDLARQQFLAHTLYSPRTLPGDFVLLWLLPVTALLLLGTEIARIRRAPAFSWLRFWALLAVCASVVSLLYLFNPTDILQNNPYLNAEYGFWLTCAGLGLSTLLLFRPRKHLSAFVPGRRALVFRGVNILALLGAGTAAISFLLSEQQISTRMRNARATFYALGIGNDPPSQTLAWSPDSKSLLACIVGDPVPSWSKGTSQPPLSLAWQQSGRVQVAVLNNRVIRNLAWSPNGRFLAGTLSSGDSRVYCWNTGNWTAFRSYTAPGSGQVQLYSLAWSPDSQRLAAGVFWETGPQGEHTLYVWETASGKPLATYTLPFQMAANIYRIAWSPDGSALAASGIAGNGKGSGEGFVCVWDAATGQVRYQYVSPTKDQIISAHAWSPNNHLLAFADGTSSDGLLAQVVPGVPIQVWDITANRLVRTYTGHILGINAISWSPDGKRLIAGGDDGTVQVWDVTSGEQLLVYQGHQGQNYIRILDVAWSPDGTMIASATSDEVRVWDAP